MNTNILKKTLRFFTWAWIIIVGEAIMFTPKGPILIVQNYAFLIRGSDLTLGYYNVTQEACGMRTGV